MIPFSHGFLVEYALSVPPLVLAFDFNPQQLSRNRSVSITLGNTPATRVVALASRRGRDDGQGC